MSPLPLLPLTFADITRCTPVSGAYDGVTTDAAAAKLEEAAVPADAAMGISPEVGVLEVDVAVEGSLPPGTEPPLKGPSLRRRACVAGESGAVR